MRHLDMWVVYDHPDDYPNYWVARRWEITAGLEQPTNDLLIDQSLPRLRTRLPLGLYRMERLEGDDPVIAETWF